MEHAASDGLGCQRDHVRVLDTRDLAWQDFPGIPGGRTKVLSRDADGHATIMLNWLPPTLAVGTPERHAHRTVVEHGYVLAGALPVREYAGPDDHTGERVLFRPGYYYARRPGSIHGLDTNNLGRGIGFLILEWRSGPGTYLWEDGVEHETRSLPLTASGDAPRLAARPGDGVVLERDDVTILDTREMGWEEHPVIRDGMIKVLERDPTGAPVVKIDWMAPGPSGDADERRLHRSSCERGFVLDGDRRQREYEDGDDVAGQALHLRQGYFYERRPGSVHGLDPSPDDAGATGISILTWRSAP